MRNDQTNFTEASVTEGGVSEASSNARTILTVDDDPIILMNTAALLEDLGHKVFEAGSAREAIDHLTEHPEIDLLITDQLMPGMTGSELIDAARALRPDLPVILTTGFSGDQGNRTRGLTRLNKPYGFAELEAVVGRVKD